MLERDFKASSDSRDKSNNFDQNGLFVCSCARHGIVRKMFDVFAGEGYINDSVIRYVLAFLILIYIYIHMCRHKFALASVALEEAANTKKLPVDIMYDICCLVLPSLKVFIFNIKYIE